MLLIKGIDIGRELTLKIVIPATQNGISNTHPMNCSNVIQVSSG